LDRNIKKTKNGGENDASNNGSGTSSPLNENTVGKNAMLLSQSQANRYDTTCAVKKFQYGSNHSTLSPKFLYNSFSEVANRKGECMPNSVVNSPKFLKPNVHTQIGQKEVEKGITGAGLTSIGGVHVAVTPRHADEGRAVTASGARAANAVSPPVAPAGQASGLMGVQPYAWRTSQGHAAGGNVDHADYCIQGE
jgi:hypothetical protein